MNDSALSAPRRPAIGVGIVILRPRGESREVVLIRRGNPPRQGGWSIPGGHQELGETVRAAATREAMEETGLTITNLKLVDVVDAIYPGADGSVADHWTLIDFRADWAGGELTAGGDALEARWVPLSEVDRYKLWNETAEIIAAAARMQ